MQSLPEADANRRPLKTRGWTLFVKLADRLARWGVSPNAISLSSIAWAALAGGAFWLTADAAGAAARALFLLAAAGIQLRLIANLLDGMVAVEGGRRSPVGELYNEAPDRIADSLILLGAGQAAGNLLLGCGAALLAVLVAYVRALGASAGAGQVFAGPMAKPHRMALLTITSLYCMAAPAGGPWWLAPRYAMHLALWVIAIGCGVTFARRLIIIAGRMRQAEGHPL